MLSSLLEVKDLQTRFRLDGGREARAVDGVSFCVPEGATVGLVGESGSGKSVTALSVLRLVLPPGHIVAGSVRFRDDNLLALDERAMQKVRGNQISMIFQEPMTSLNPVMRVGDQVAEPLRLHRHMSRREALAEAVSLFRLVGIADPERRVLEYPHQLSGGMRQRVMIAMALGCRPSLLIADEPTTALDVTIQAQILELLARLRRELGMSILLITHDLGVVAETCDEVVVMYAGQVVEEATTRDLFRAPRHPYTAGLLASVPGLGPAGGKGRLREIPGMVPQLDRLPVGCRFADRCPDVQTKCRDEAPPLFELSKGRRARCFFPRPDPS